jgi:hypothetical protein
MSFFGSPYEAAGNYHGSAYVIYGRRTSPPMPGSSATAGDDTPHTAALG